MYLFQVDYLKKTGLLLREAFTFKRYKAMHPALAVFTGIFMIPFVLIGLVLTAVLSLFSFVLNILLTPLKHIHSLVHAEGQQVNHATQFWIYFLSWPIILLYYVVCSLLFAVVYVLYALLSIITYVYTLGGFKFHIVPNADSDDIAIETEGEYFAIALTYVCVAAVLFILTAVFVLIFVAKFDLDNYMRTTKAGKEVFSILKLFKDTNLILSIVFGALWFLFDFFYALIGFAPFHVKKADWIIAPVDDEICAPESIRIYDDEDLDDICDCCDCSAEEDVAVVAEEAPTADVEIQDEVAEEVTVDVE